MIMGATGRKSTVIGPVFVQASPPAPTLAQSAAGGALGAATYSYRLVRRTAVGTFNDGRGYTFAGPAATIVVAAGATNSITITDPTAPADLLDILVYGRVAGAEGFIGSFAPGGSLVDTGQAVGTLATSITGNTTLASPGTATEVAPGATSTAMPSTTRAPYALAQAGANRTQVPVS
jgi:hypothetical protein